MTKMMLMSKLAGRRMKKIMQSNAVKVREGMEEHPWVVAHPSTIPELLGETFIFTNMLPVSLPP
jgi:hypothetical protein